MEKSGTKGTDVEEITDKEAVTEKDRGWGVLVAIFVVSAQAASAEMRS